MVVVISLPILVEFKLEKIVKVVGTQTIICMFDNQYWIIRSKNVFSIHIQTILKVASNINETNDTIN